MITLDAVEAGHNSVTPGDASDEKHASRQNIGGFLLTSSILYGILDIESLFPSFLVGCAVNLSRRAALKSESMSDESTTFLASFPSIQSAIKVTGDKCGMRIQLDIPESEMGEAMPLLLWRQRILKVTVEPQLIQNRQIGIQEDDTGAVGRTKTKKRIK